MKQRMGKCYGISYASRRFSKRYGPITSEAMQSGLFTGFKCYTELDIPHSFRNMCGRWWHSPEGGGWWMWKVAILIDVFRHMKMGDTVTYFDCGCTINVTPESEKRFQHYLKMVSESKCGMLRFQLPHLERCYTNKKTVSYFKNKFEPTEEEEAAHLDSGQYVGGVFIMRKCDWTIKFLNTMLKILQEDPTLFTNHYNAPTENHRHDQSISSMLYKHMGGDCTLPDETFFPGGSGGFGTKISLDKPFWACRIGKAPTQNRVALR